METWVAATRKIKTPVPEKKVVAFLEHIVAYPVVECGADLWRSAARVALRHRIHPYDAAIVAAAIELGATVLYSEDLNDGQIYDGVRVVNPFRELQ
jgi:predicted nucleic acid-binding protein